MRPLARDQTDYPPQPMRPSNYDIFCLAAAIVFHVVDICTDAQVAIHYYNLGYFYYFLATVLILLIPSFVNSCVSYRMYNMDEEDQDFLKTNRKMKCWRFLLLLPSFAPILRYIASLRYAWKSRKAERVQNKEKQERYYKLMLKEDADVALLRVFECFLEAAPQTLLQVSFLLKQYQDNTFKHGYDDYKPIASVVSSFAGMALSLMTYQRNIRFVQEDKDNVSKIGSAFIFLWHFFVTISRILMLSAMVYISWLWALISMTIHWIVMTFSLALLEEHDFCSSSSAIRFNEFRIHETLCNFMFSAVLGLVYIFTYITPGEGSTRNRYLGFYLICLIENVVGAAIWHHFSKIATWFTAAMTICCVVPYLLGCLCMVIYHQKFHPKHFTQLRVLPKRRQTQVPEESQLPTLQNKCESGTIKNGAIPHQDAESNDKISEDVPEETQNLHQAVPLNVTK